MDKRVLMASVVSMGVVLVWIAFFGKPQARRQPTRRRRPRRRSASATANPATANPATAQGAADAAKRARSRRQAGATRRRPTTGRRRRRRAKPTPVETTLEQPRHYRATFTSEGAAPATLGAARSAVQGRQSAREQQAGGADRSRQDARRRICRSTISFPQSAFDAAARRGVDEQPRDERRRARVRLGRRRHARREALRAGAEHATRSAHRHRREQERQAARALLPRADARLARSERQAGRHVRRARQPDRGRRATSAASSSTRTSTSCSRRRRSKSRGDVRWVGVGEQYFVDGVALAQSPEEKACNVSGAADGSISSSILTVGSRTVPAHGKTEYEMVGFMGPKILSQLDAVKVGGQTAQHGRRHGVALRLDRVARAPDAGGAQGDPLRRAELGRRHHHPHDPAQGGDLVPDAEVDEVDEGDGQAQAGDGQAQGALRRRQERSSTWRRWSCTRSTASIRSAAACRC